jgi:hypothetical protein
LRFLSSRFHFVDQCLQKRQSFFVGKFGAPILAFITIESIRWGGLKRKPEGPGFSISDMASEIAACVVRQRCTGVSQRLEQMRAPFDKSNHGRPIDAARTGDGGYVAAQSPYQFKNHIVVQSTHAKTPMSAKRTRTRRCAGFRSRDGAYRQPAAHAPTSPSFSLRGRVARTKGRKTFFILRGVFAKLGRSETIEDFEE